MASLIWAICCQRAIVDRDTHALSLIDHLEGVTLPVLPPKREDGALPLIPIRFAVATYWVRSDEAVAESFDLRVRLLDPTGASHAEGKTIVDLQSTVASRNIVGFPGLPISAAGIYTVELSRKFGGEWSVEAASPKIRVLVAGPAPESVTPVSRAAHLPRRARKK